MHSLLLVLLMVYLSSGFMTFDYSPFCKDLADITNFCDEPYSDLLCAKTCSTTNSFRCGIRQYGPVIPEVEVEKEEKSTFKRIVGGKESTKGAWPWTVVLRFKGVVRCMGAVISKDWVLTAASCFDNDYSSFDEKDWHVVAGNHKMTHSEDVEQSTPVKKIIIHPENYRFWKIAYLNIPDDYDVALLKVKNSFTLSSHVFPVCLLNSQDHFDSNSECRVNGWGKSQSSHIVHDIPREAQVRLVTRDQCNKPIAYNGTIHHRAICGDFEVKNGIKADACNQDSGGALSCKKNGRWTAVGLVSWGYKCGKPTPYGVFTNLRIMKSWIVKTILGYSEQFNVARSMPEVLGQLNQDETLNALKNV